MNRWHLSLSIDEQLSDNDLVVEILYSGVCHSDLHQARNDWGWSTYPMVPGHEIVGQVIEVGSAVKKYKVGDKVGIGCMVDSCLHCDQCLTGEEQLCRKAQYADIQLARPYHWREYLWRLRQAHRGPRRVCCAGARHSGPFTRRPFALRRHHDICAFADL